MTTLRLVTRKRTPGEQTPLGARLEWLLELTGLSGRELAGKAGVSHALVGQIIRGENRETRRDKIEAFARAADVDPGWLLTGAGQPRKGLVAPQLGTPPTVAPDSPQPPSPMPPSPTPMSPGVAKKAENGRWRVFAAGRPLFAAAATEALEAGASDRILDAAADRLVGQAPTYEAAVQAIVDAATGAATFRRLFALETADTVPGSLHANESQPTGPGGRGRTTSSR